MTQVDAYNRPMIRIHTIDCNYIRPQFAAAYLIEDGKRACFIENNTTHAVPYLLKKLEEVGLKPDSVEWIMVTHAHLDHAGGTSALLPHCPNATLVAHPKAARTLIDPTRLIASTQKVYGEENFKNLYGVITGIDAKRVKSMADGESFEWGELEFSFLHTLGHSSHHFCIMEHSIGAIFTGDAFGVRYPQVSADFIFPSTSPIDFDPEEAKKSIHRIVDSGAAFAYLTHYGKLTDLKKAAKEILIHLEFHEEVLENAKKSPLMGKDLVQECASLLLGYFKKQLALKNIPDTPANWEVLNLDIEINAQGIAYVAEKSRL